jgi:hypothetical protein
MKETIVNAQPASRASPWPLRSASHAEARALDDAMLTLLRRYVPAVLLLLGPLVTVPAVEARSRPGNPANLTATAENATTVAFTFTNTAARDELVRYEVEQTVNGVRISHAAESALSQRMSWSGTGDGWSQFGGGRIRDATPMTEYCFRVYARFVDSGVRSTWPSNWGCARTPPHPPLAPLDVKAEFTTVATDRPRLSWSTPDQSGWRGIDRYVIERQSPPGQNRPWILEKAVSGPRGEQNASTRLVFATGTTAVDPQTRHAYRVCSENDGGRVCAKPVLAVASGPGSTSQQADTSKVKLPADPTAAATQSLDGARTQRPTASVSQPPASPPPAPGTQSLEAARTQRPTASVSSLPAAQPATAQAPAAQPPAAQAPTTYPPAAQASPPGTQTLEAARTQPRPTSTTLGAPRTTQSTTRSAFDR